jgi:dTDP-4-dehydrorhamnose 3,5-epimerase
MPFTFHETPLPGVVRIQTKLFGDERGYFKEGFKASEFEAAGLPTVFLQDNTSRSRRNVVRGLHYQTDPQSQGKLVGVTQGAVFDVAVDVRVGSPTFGEWFGAELSEDNGTMLWIPPGFAHGFSVLTEWADLVYKCTNEFSAAHDGGVLWNDPAIGVDWQVTDPIVSGKDQLLLPLADTATGFRFNG